MTTTGITGRTCVARRGGQRCSLPLAHTGPHVHVDGDDLRAGDLLIWRRPAVTMIDEIRSAVTSLAPLAERLRTAGEGAVAAELDEVVARLAEALTAAPMSRPAG